MLCAPADSPNPFQGRNLVEKTEVDRTCRALFVQRRVGKKAKRTEAVVNRDNHHAAPRQSAAVKKRKPAAAEDERAAMDPHHHRQFGAGLGAGSKHVQVKAVLVELARVAAAFERQPALGVMRWLQTVTLPGIMAQAIDHQHLLRAMDALVDHKEEVDTALSGLLRPLVDQALAMVFYDMTTIRAAGLSQQEQDVRHFGMSKEGVIARQVMLGVVQTAEGLPLYHEVFDGNMAEVTTLKPVIEKIVKQFPIKRIIAVADRGFLSTDNLADLQAIALPGGGALEFILAVPGRRYGDFVELLEPFHSAQCLNAQAEVLGEAQWNKLRLIIAHDPQVALDAGAQRDSRIQTLLKQAAQWSGKLDAQDSGKKGRGRKLSDGGARARFYREVCDAHLSRIIKVDLTPSLSLFRRLRPLALGKPAWMLGLFEKVKCCAIIVCNKWL